MHDEKKPGWEARIERLRQASPEERLQAAARQRWMSAELLRAGLRSRHPDLDDAAIEEKRAEVIFGPEVWREIRERRRRCALRDRAT